MNAAWDMAGRRAGKPVSATHRRSLTPEQIVELIDFRYISDALTPGRGIDGFYVRPKRAPEPTGWRLYARMATRHTRLRGWLGYSDEKLVRLASQAVADGFRTIKLKVGLKLRED